jgi:hypothetical protein
MAASHLDASVRLHANLLEHLLEHDRFVLRLAIDYHVACHMFLCRGERMLDRDVIVNVAYEFFCNREAVISRPAEPDPASPESNLHGIISKFILNDLNLDCFVRITFLATTEIRHRERIPPNVGMGTDTATYLLAVPSPT